MNMLLAFLLVAGPASAATPSRCSAELGPGTISTLHVTLRPLGDSQLQVIIERPDSRICVARIRAVCLMDAPGACEAGPSGAASLDCLPWASTVYFTGGAAPTPREVRVDFVSNGEERSLTYVCASGARARPLVPGD